MEGESYTRNEDEVVAIKPETMTRTRKVHNLYLCLKLEEGEKEHGDNDVERKEGRIMEI